MVAEKDEVSLSAVVSTTLTLAVVSTVARLQEDDRSAADQIAGIAYKLLAVAKANGYVHVEGRELVFSADDLPLRESP
jgi:membrane protein implicated in regulation of membrane protease activity